MSYFCFMEVILIPAKPKEVKKQKLRVAAYCRVSSADPEQIASLESQVYYYERKIKSNKSWLYRGVYYDVGRMLKDKGVDMFFENENLKLSDQQTEFVLTVISAVAQEESRNISENIKWGYQRKFERGEIQTKYKNFMGYTEKNGELVIVPEEATIVKKIFELYAEGYSIRKICSYLEDNGIKTKTGKTKWAPNVIGKMLHNEKYKGCTLMQKTYSEDLLSGKRKKNRGEIKQYYYEDTHPAIVSKELYEKVQLQLNAK